LKLVVQVIWPMVNMKPSAIAAMSEMMAIWIAWEAVHTPPTWHTIVNERWSKVYLGVCPM
jgi:hypothetical protein